MGTIYGNTSFEDLGNAPEVYVQANAIPAWERLSGDLARLFVCREVGERMILDHTDLMDRATMFAIGRRFIEIAEEMGKQSPTLWSKMTLNKMLM